jgi:hypothetical protein
MNAVYEGPETSIPGPEQHASQLANQNTKIIRFETNIPVHLAYRDAKEVNGRYGPQWMYRLTDGRIAYFDEPVVTQIRGLEIKPGESFTVCKCEVRELGAARSTIRWHVKQDQNPIPAPKNESSPVSVSNSGRPVALLKMPMDRAVVADTKNGRLG